MKSRRRGQVPERGAVTAEAALMLPLLAAFAVCLTWLISLGVVHARAVDAAREAARVVARGESTGQGVSLARQVATQGARVSVSQGADRVRVTVEAPVRGPGGLLGFLPDFDVKARAVAAREPTS